MDTPDRSSRQSTTCRSSSKKILACVAAAAATALPQVSAGHPSSTSASTSMHRNRNVKTVSTTASSSQSRTPSQATAAMQKESVHESMWGCSPESWVQEDPEPLNRYVDLSQSYRTYNCFGNGSGGSSTNSMLLMRGGTDEATPAAATTPAAPTTSTSTKKKSSSSSKKNKKKKRHGGSKKKSTKQSSPVNTTQQQAEEEAESTSAAAATSSSSGSSESPPAAAPTANPMCRSILGHDNYYDILGLSKGENDSTLIKKAYRRRAVQTHPDKTEGDRRAFDKLAEAYDVLSDDDKRVVYDRYGKAGLDPTNNMAAASGAGGRGGMHSAAEDMFRSFFGGNGQQQQQQQEAAASRNRTLRYQLEVTLEELYQGKTRKVTVEAPAPQRQSYYQEPPPRHRNKKQVEVTIPRGGQPGQGIVLSGAMDFDNDGDGQPPGDLIFQVHPRPHKTFTRKGHDLAVEIKISFQEAICGCQRSIRHLDGRIIAVSSAKRHIAPPSPLDGSNNRYNDDDDDDFILEQDAASATLTPSIYIQTGDVQVVKGQGMPKNRQGTEFGDLYIQYSVELPTSGSTDSLTPSERIELARLLEKIDTTPATTKSSWKHFNKLSSPTAATPAQKFALQPASLMDFGRASGPVRMEEDDEDDHDDDQGQQSQHFPFGSGAGQRQFFFSSAAGRSPFFGQETNFEDDPNVQCSQM